MAACDLIQSGDGGGGMPERCILVRMMMDAMMRRIMLLLLLLLPHALQYRVEVCNIRLLVAASRIEYVCRQRYRRCCIPRTGTTAIIVVFPPQLRPPPFQPLGIIVAHAAPDGVPAPAVFAFDYAGQKRCAVIVHDDDLAPNVVLGR